MLSGHMRRQRKCVVCAAWLGFLHAVRETLHARFAHSFRRDPAKSESFPLSCGDTLMSCGRHRSIPGFQFTPRAHMRCLLFMSNRTHRAFRAFRISCSSGITRSFTSMRTPVAQMHVHEHLRWENRCPSQLLAGSIAGLLQTKHTSAMRLLPLRCDMHRLRVCLL